MPPGALPWDRVPSVATAQGLEGRSRGERLAHCPGPVLIRVFSFGRPQRRTRLDSARRISAGSWGAGGVEEEHTRPGQKALSQPGRALTAPASALTPFSSCSQAHVFPTQWSAQTPAAGLRSEGPLPTSSPVTRCWAVCLSSWLRKMFGAE
ncbi:hypothetical protein R6Z07M_009263 [Ovis aries]